MNDTQDKTRWLATNQNGVRRKDTLALRQRIIETVRAYFKEQRFFEAEIPLLVSGTTPDPGIQSFELHDKYLTTSTEYHIKRMIAGGFARVFTLTKNFRQYEHDATHNPEFTMLEWARKDTALNAIEQDIINLVMMIQNALFPHTDTLAYQGRPIPLHKDRWQTITFQELFNTQYGIVIPESYTIEDTPALAERAGLTVEEPFRADPGLLVSELLSGAIKRIGFDAPALLTKWPAMLASSADSPALEARWNTRTEVIIGGLEIADGFPFLRDAALQRSLFERANTRRSAARLPRVTCDESYLAMLKNGLCPGAGMALGIDRLCMLFANTRDIRDVLCFAWDEL